MWRWPQFDTVALTTLVLLVTALNQVWVALDNRPPDWDQARHLGNSLVFLSAFSWAHPFAWLTTNTMNYPPLTYWVTDAFYAAFGRGDSVAILSDVVFLAILAFSTYGIGKLLWNRRVGLLSAVFIVTTPVMVSSFKKYMLDSPLTAIVALSMYLLIRTESFSRRGPSLWFGAACGLGMLTKEPFVFILTMPVAMTLFTGTRQARQTGTVADFALNLAGVAVVAVAVCGIWYLHNLSQLTSYQSGFGSTANAIAGSPPVSSLASFGWYFWVLINIQLYAIPFLLFVVGVAYVFASSSSAQRNLLLVLLIAGTYLTFTLWGDKDPRYTFPMLPAVAVIAVSWLEYLAPRVRRILSGGIVVYGAVAFLAISFGTSLLPKHLKLGKGDTSVGFTLFAQHGFVVGPPSGERWYQQEVFAQMASTHVQPATFTFDGPDSEWFNTWGTRYYSLMYHETWVASANLANFLVFRNIPNPSVPAGFAQAGRWTLADGEWLFLYQRSQPIGTTPGS